jgi:phosphoribosylanthranilate isomerase
MKPFIKICGLRTLKEVQTCVEAGADAVGFVLSPSPRQVPLQIAKALLRDLPAFVTGFLVVRQWTEFSPALLPPRAHIQGSGTNPGFPSNSLFPALRDGPNLLEHTRAYRQLLGPQTLLLVDGPRAGSGTAANWARVAQVAAMGPICLAGGLTPDNVGEAISRVQPAGVDVSSGVESSPGQKDLLLIQAFIQAAKEAAHSVRSSTCTP